MVDFPELFFDLIVKRQKSRQDNGCINFSILITTGLHADGVGTEGKDGTSITVVMSTYYWVDFIMAPLF